jgi:hypothetical protein
VLFMSTVFSRIDAGLLSHLPLGSGRRWAGRCARLLLAAVLSGAALSPTRAAQEPPAATAPPADAKEAEGWVYEASAYGYLFQGGEGDFVLPIFRADHDALHLEARYNYEDRRTGSLFGGWTFSFGEKTTLDLTPMLGAVFGDTDGIAPGLELYFQWGPLEYYSESEIVFDLHDETSSFFYNWSELTGRPLKWLRAGLALQRTRVYETDRDVQWGVVTGFSFWKMEIGAYYFNADDAEDRFGILSATVSF